MRIVTSGLLLFVLALVACGDEAPIGGPCDTPGATTECGDNAVCTNTSSVDGQVCRRLCDAQTDCEVGEKCNGVSNGNLKSCQPSSS